MKYSKTIKNIVTIAILISVSVIFSCIDNVISQSIFAAIKVAIPSFKLGLANIVVLIYIYFYKIKDGLIAVTLKSILVALIYAGITGFMIGFSGTIVSFLVMTLLYKILKEDKYLIFISFVGSITHTLCQVLTAFIIYGIMQIESYLIYLPIVLPTSAIMGILVGIISKKVIKMLKASTIMEEKI